MADKHDEASVTEAKNLAVEAKEAERHGDREEADFLMQAAKEIDPKAAEEAANSAGKSGE
jgi:hypothetical protein